MRETWRGRLVGTCFRLLAPFTVKARPATAAEARLHRLNRALVAQYARLRDRLHATERALAEAERRLQEKEIDWSVERRRLEADADASRAEVLLLAAVTERNQKRVEAETAQAARLINEALDQSQRARK